MKKISLFMSLIALAAGFCACSHDNDSYCDAGFKDTGCFDGEYVYCHFESESEDARGVVKSVVEIELNHIVYVCNGKDVLVPRDYSCTAGVLNKDGQPVKDNAICNDDLTLVSCDGNDLITGVQVCNDNAIISCERKGATVSTYTMPCAGNTVCENYERNDKNYAGCFNKEDITKGCDAGVNALGTCDANGGLTFCTSKNPAKGQTIRLDCQKRGQSCMLINDEYGYDCSATCKDESGKLYNEHGVCDGKTLSYCKVENGNISYDKVECQNACGFDDFQYDCI